MKTTFEITTKMYHSMNEQVKSMDWSPHKNEIQSLINGALAHHNSSKKNALIFGAGNCNDLNLSNIAQHFDYKVHLLDMDQKNHRLAIAKESVEVKKKLKEVIKDITGLYRIMSY